MNNLVFIRCDASEKIGLGHLSRSISIAENLQDKYGLKVFLIMREGEDLIKKVSKRDFKFITNSKEKEILLKEDYWILSLCDLYKPSIFIFDVRNEISAKCIEQISKREIKTILS